MNCAIVYSRLNLTISREVRGVSVCVCLPLYWCWITACYSPVPGNFHLHLWSTDKMFAGHVPGWQYNFPVFNSNLEPFWKDVEFFKGTERPQCLWVPSHWFSELVDRHFMSRYSLGYILHENGKYGHVIILFKVALNTCKNLICAFTVLLQNNSFASSVLSVLKLIALGF